MNDEKEKAKAEAVEDFRFDCDIDRHNSSAEFCFEKGFDFGYAAAQPQWIAIHSEADLPKEDGRYLWKVRAGEPSNVRAQWFDPQGFNMLNGSAKAYFISEYEAWMPIPDYTSPEGEDGRSN
jgi:hypothetical protein